MPNDTNENSNWRQSQSDFFKAFYDHLKHVATLSTASILLLSTFLDKFSKPQYSGLVAISIAALFISLVNSLLAYTLLLLAFPRPGLPGPGKLHRRLSVVSLFTTWLFFLVGIGSIAAFFLVNWYGQH
jgi:hypothetical protein